MGTFLSSVILYRVWEYFEKGIRAVKHELYIDVNETSEEHRQFVHGLGNLIKARENGHPTRQVPSTNGAQGPERTEEKAQGPVST